MKKDLHNITNNNSNRDPSFSKLITIYNTIDNSENDLLINEFSSFLCSYNSAYIYNQSFLPLLYEKFITYIKAFNEYDKELDYILNLLKYEKNKPNGEKQQKEFLISINNYLQTNLLGDKKIISNKSANLILNWKKDMIITFSYKNEICAFKGYIKKDINLELDKKSIINYYNYLLNLRRSYKISKNRNRVKLYAKNPID